MFLGVVMLIKSLYKTAGLASGPCVWCTKTVPKAQLDEVHCPSCHISFSTLFLIKPTLHNWYTFHASTHWDLLTHHSLSSFPKVHKAMLERITLFIKISKKDLGKNKICKTVLEPDPHQVQSWLCCRIPFRLWKKICISLIPPFPDTSCQYYQYSIANWQKLPM